MRLIDADTLISALKNRSYKSTGWNDKTNKFDLPVVELKDAILAIEERPVIVIGADLDENNENKIYKNAIEYYGETAQMFKVMEECAELIRAISRDDAENIIEETADVLIMCEQLKLMYGVDEVEKVKAEKLARLKDRLNKEE